MCQHICCTVLEMLDCLLRGKGHRSWSQLVQTQKDLRWVSSQAQEQCWLGHSGSFYLMDICQQQGLGLYTLH